MTSTTTTSLAPQIAVIGTGTWGCASAIIIARKHPQQRVILWGRNAEKCAQMQAQRRHPLLPDITLPEAIHITSDPQQLEDCTLVFWAVPTQHSRAQAVHLAAHIHPSAALVSLSKGLEQDSHMSVTHILASVFDPAHSDSDSSTSNSTNTSNDNTNRTHRYGVLSGPSHAEEVAAGLPAGVVVAGSDTLCAAVVAAMHHSSFRIYTCADVIGVEMGGALKNVIAIAAGICDGMKLGDNIKATLVTRGLAEIRRLGRALTAEDSSFAGLAGIGDLLTTCYSPFGRNRLLGERIGSGESASDILADSTMVAEGAWTCRAVVALGERLNIELPVSEQVTAVLWHGKPLAEAMHDLLSRDSKDETL